MKKNVFPKFLQSIQSPTPTTPRSSGFHVNRISLWTNSTVIQHGNALVPRLLCSNIILDSTGKNIKGACVKQYTDKKTKTYELWRMTSLSLWLEHKTEIPRRQWVLHHNKTRDPFQPETFYWQQALTEGFLSLSFLALSNPFSMHLGIHE